MHVESGRLARMRAFEVAPSLFRRAALAALAAVFVVVTTGATVRLTASGLGCENWPRCGDTPFPEKDYHAFIEFGNRVIALVAIGFTLVAWLAARRTTGLPRLARRLSLAAFLGNVAQIPLGGLTVLLELHPLLVMSHFLLAMAVLGAAAVVAVEAQRLVEGAGPPAPRSLRLLGTALALAAFVLVVTGAFATAAGPHAGGEDIARLGDPLRSVYVHAAATLVFACSFVLLLARLAGLRRRAPRLLGAGLALAGLLALQIGVGEIQYHTDLPWRLVLLHVALAALVWAASVTLAAVLWRPPASFSARSRID